MTLIIVAVGCLSGTIPKLKQFKQPESSSILSRNPKGQHKAEGLRSDSQALKNNLINWISSVRSYKRDSAVMWQNGV